MHDHSHQVKLSLLKDALLAERAPSRRMEIRQEITLVEALMRATRENEPHD